MGIRKLVKKPKKSRTDQLQKAHQRQYRKNIIKKYPPLKQKKWIFTDEQINHRGRKHLFKIICELFFCYQNRMPIIPEFAKDHETCIADLMTIENDGVYPVLLKGNPAKYISEKTKIPISSVKAYILALRKCGLVQSHQFGTLKLYSVGIWKFIIFGQDDKKDDKKDDSKNMKWETQWKAYPNLTKNTVHELETFNTSR